ncbi:MAG TPA: VCBS repeat-containing protein [Chryseolinea sp.]|nr:VCBS repeat-containing protein [Chryseolinea sp.]
MRVRISCFIVAIVLLQCTTDKQTLLFEEAPLSQTHVDFINAITLGDSISVLDFEYLYNGGGVALIDINNDGLQDIYFTGNMVSSRLYLNKGKLQFEDITTLAGVATTKWANGVAIVDINQDGFKDIYVSVGGNRKTPEKDRKNLLFINDHDNTFTESAGSYGLAETGYGIQSAFLDYDHDGDLDMYHLRNAFVSYSRNTSKPKMINGEAASTDKLFRNNGDNTFTDVSKEAGILIEGFGLGVEVCDINEDGWPDVYVSNDFITNDLLYINNRNGTFTNQVANYLKHQTYNAMGCDVADYNNDGKVDIVVLDMLPEDNKRWKLTSRGNTFDEFQNGIRLGYEHQYIRNTLQLNNGNGSFSEIGQLAGIEATDWSWSALLADYDNDGLKDLFITNGYKQDIINLDFVVYGDKNQTMGLSEASAKERQALLNELPGVKIHNYMYRNNGDLTFRDVSQQWGTSKPTYSNGAAYGDLDNDGDLDLVFNNMDEPATIMESKLVQSNTDSSSNYLRVTLKGSSLNREGLGTKVMLSSNGGKQFQYFNPVRGYLSTVEPVLHFGLGNLGTVDSLEVVWPDGKSQLLRGIKANQVLQLDYASAMVSSGATSGKDSTLFHEKNNLGLDFTQTENAFVDFKLQPAIPHMHSKNGPGITVGDVNGDGLEDVYVGGSLSCTGALFIQRKGGRFERKLMLDSVKREQLGVLFFDADNDGDQDLYTVIGGSENGKTSALYQDILYLNDGSGTFNASPTSLPTDAQSGSCVIADDYDLDGDLDLFVGGRLTPGEYPMPGGSYLLRNDSKQSVCKFTDITQEIDGLKNIGMVCAALWTDYDNDGWRDLLITGEFMPLTFFHNNKGKLINDTGSTDLKHTSGWWNSISAGDFDGDGDMDYIAGNQGTNSHFHPNEKEPLCIYASDYNGDGRLDPVMSHYVQGEKYISHSRDNLIDQINGMRARFRTYTDYATKTFDEAFLPEELDKAFVICGDRFESSYVENSGNGKFTIRSLPTVAQFSPAFGMVVEDYDGDGFTDVLVAGNSYAPEISSGRDDASVGLYLKGNGKGQLTPVPVAKSGFMADDDGKGMARLITDEGYELIVVGNNSGKLRTYTTANRSKHFFPKMDDVYALVMLSNGKTYKHEFYYGSTYLSQSSRSLAISPALKNITIFDAKGNSRNINLHVALSE